VYGLFGLARIHLANEYEWRRTGKWPGEDAPHGHAPAALSNPALAIEPISPRPNLLRYTPPRADAGVAQARRAA
jgi:hypothetical protein